MQLSLIQMVEKWNLFAQIATNNKMFQMYNYRKFASGLNDLNKQIHKHQEKKS